MRFIDSIPIKNFVSALSLNDFPVNLIKNIKVCKGVVPTSLRADALGGAINIFIGSRYVSFLKAPLENPRQKSWFFSFICLSPASLDIIPGYISSLSIAEKRCYSKSVHESSRVHTGKALQSPGDFSIIKLDEKMKEN